MSAWSYSMPPPLEEAQALRWQQLLEARTGIDLSQHRSILESGLQRRLRALGHYDYAGYYAHVAKWPEGIPEWRALLDCLTVRETRFFRQPAAFRLVHRFLVERVMKAPDATLDLWSAGCAGGEEACSLAMIAGDVAATSSTPRYFGVLGTDISNAALTQARAGRYGARQVERVPPPLRARYLLADGPDHFRLQSSLAARLCWTNANLLEADGGDRWPTMDVIFCQNVLPYFRQWRARQVLDMLALRLKPGGLLILGPGEVPYSYHPELKSCAADGVNAWIRLDEQVRCDEGTQHAMRSSRQQALRAGPARSGDRPARR